MNEDINDTIKIRIIDTANRLYELADREKFPTVESVRREAKADMNLTSLVMKEWRLSQTAQPKKVAVAVPESVMEPFQIALSSAWQAAVEEANASLDAARRAWEVERSETEEQRVEMADAFDAQHQELLNSELELQAAEQIRQEMENELSELKMTLQKTELAGDALQERLKDRDTRINELKIELANTRTDLEEQQHEHDEQITAIKTNLQQEMNVLRENLGTAKAQTEHWKTEADKSAKKEADTIAQNNSLRENLNTEKAQTEYWRTATDKSVKAESESIKQAKSLQKENTRMDIKIRELNARLDSAAREIKKVDDRNETLQGKLIDLVKNTVEDK